MGNELKNYRVSFVAKSGRDDDNVKYDVSAKDTDDAFKQAYAKLKRTYGNAPYDYFTDGWTQEVPDGPKVIGIRFSHTEPHRPAGSENYLAIRAETEEQAVEYYNKHYKGKHFYQPWPKKIDDNGPCVYGAVKETYYIAGPGFDADAIEKRLEDKITQAMEQDVDIAYHIAEEIFKDNDQDSWNLLNNYLKADEHDRSVIDTFCINLCGWSFESIINISMENPALDEAINPDAVVNEEEIPIDHMDAFIEDVNRKSPDRSI